MMVSRWFLFSLMMISICSCNSLSEEVEKKMNNLQNKADSLDALINQEVEKVTNLDSLVNTEQQKVKQLDSLIQKTGSRVDSLAGSKVKQLEKWVR